MQDGGESGTQPGPMLSAVGSCAQEPVSFSHAPPCDYSEALFVEMLKKLRNQLGHVMTDEELARIPSNEQAGKDDPVD